MSAALWALLALAGAPDPPPGKAEYDRAAELYRSGDPEAALPLFQAAVERSGRRPSTLRALAQCHRVLGELDAAIALFREYLATGPADAEEVGLTVTVLEQARLEARRLRPLARDATKAEAPAPEPRPVLGGPVVAAPPPPPVEEPGVAWWWWVALGAAAVGAGVAVGVVFGMSEAPNGGTTGRVLSR